MCIHIYTHTYGYKYVIFMGLPPKERALAETTQTLSSVPSPERHPPLSLLPGWEARSTANQALIVQHLHGGWK